MPNMVVGLPDVSGTPILFRKRGLPSAVSSISNAGWKHLGDHCKKISIRARNGQVGAVANRNITAMLKKRKITLGLLVGCGKALKKHLATQIPAVVMARASGDAGWTHVRFS